VTKLSCFKHDNPTLLTLSKIASVITAKRVSVTLELKRKKALLELD